MKELKYMVCRVVQWLEHAHLMDSSIILGEVAGSSPATATHLMSHKLVDFFSIVLYYEPKRGQSLLPI